MTRLLLILGINSAQRVEGLGLESSPGRIHARDYCAGRVAIVSDPVWRVSSEYEGGGDH